MAPDRGPAPVNLLVFGVFIVESGSGREVTGGVPRSLVRTVDEDMPDIMLVRFRRIDSVLSVASGVWLVARDWTPTTRRCIDAADVPETPETAEEMEVRCWIVFRMSTAESFCALPRAK